MTVSWLCPGATLIASSPDIAPVTSQPFDVGTELVAFNSSGRLMATDEDRTVFVGETITFRHRGWPPDFPLFSWTGMPVEVISPNQWKPKVGEAASFDFIVPDHPDSTCQSEFILFHRSEGLGIDYDKSLRFRSDQHTSILFIEGEVKQKLFPGDAREPALRVLKERDFICARTLAVQSEHPTEHGFLLSSTLGAGAPSPDEFVIGPNATLFYRYTDPARSRSGSAYWLTSTTSDPRKFDLDIVGKIFSSQIFLKT